MAMKRGGSLGLAVALVGAAAVAMAGTPERVALAYRFEPGQRIDSVTRTSGRLYVSGLPQRDDLPSAFAIDIRFDVGMSERVMAANADGSGQVVRTLESLGVQLAMLDRRVTIRVAGGKATGRVSGERTSPRAMKAALAALGQLFSRPVEVAISPQGEIGGGPDLGGALAGLPGSEYVGLTASKWGGRDFRWQPLPDRPVEVGEVWTSQRLYVLVVGRDKAVKVPYLVTEIYQLERIEEREGGPVAILRSTFDARPQGEPVGISVVVRQTGRAAFDLTAGYIRSAAYTLQLMGGVQVPVPGGAAGEQAHVNCHGTLSLNYRAQRAADGAVAAAP